MKMSPPMIAALVMGLATLPDLPSRSREPRDGTGTTDDSVDESRKRSVQSTINDNYARIYREERLAKRRALAERLAARKRA